MTNIRVDKHYDLIIIGAGSGNSIPGPEFDDKSIAIIEKGKFGGTCLNVGCIPTKMFVYTSEVAETIRTSGNTTFPRNSPMWHGQKLSSECSRIASTPSRQVAKPIVVAPKPPTSMFMTTMRSLLVLKY